MNIIKRPTVAPFPREKALFIQPAPNGGFIVHLRPYRDYEMSEILGAYTTAAEMLVALSDALDPASALPEVPTQ